MIPGGTTINQSFLYMRLVNGGSTTVAKKFPPVFGVFISLKYAGCLLTLIEKITLPAFSKNCKLWQRGIPTMRFDQRRTGTYSCMRRE